MGKLGYVRHVEIIFTLFWTIFRSKIGKNDQKRIIFVKNWFLLNFLRFFEDSMILKECDWLWEIHKIILESFWDIFWVENRRKLSKMVKNWHKFVFFDQKWIFHNVLKFFGSLRFGVGTLGHKWHVETVFDPFGYLLGGFCW